MIQSEYGCIRCPYCYSTNFDFNIKSQDEIFKIKDTTIICPDCDKLLHIKLTVEVSLVK